MTGPAGRRRTDGMAMVVLTTKLVVAITALLVAMASVVASVVTLLAARAR